MTATALSVLLPSESSASASANAFDATDSATLFRVSSETSQKGNFISNTMVWPSGKAQCFESY